MALGAGEQPCVFRSWGGGPLVEYVQSDLVLDLTDYLEEDNYKDRFVEASWGPATVDDRIYGVPVENTAIAVFWYNEEVFEEHGLEEPETYEELLEIVDTLIDAGVAPFALANQPEWPGSMYYMYLVDRLGGTEAFSAAADREGGSFLDDPFIEAGEMLQDLVDRGAFVEGFQGLDWDAGESRALLYTGDAAMELMGSWNVSTFRAENEEFFENNVGWFPFPEIEGGDGDPSNVLGTIGDNYYHVSSTCEHPDEAFEVIQYLIDDESVAERAEIGRIPPLEDFEPEDPVAAELYDHIQDANAVQLWYDQYLPPEVAEVHLSTLQQLYGAQVTPEEKGEAMEAAIESYFEEEALGD